MPSVSLGGVVVVVNLAAHTITASLAAAGTSALVNGASSYVLSSGGTGASAPFATFVSDGTNWWAV